MPKQFREQGGGRKGPEGAWKRQFLFGFLTGVLFVASVLAAYEIGRHASAPVSDQVPILSKAAPPVR